MATEDAIRLIDNMACSRVKHCIIKLVSRGNMRSLIVNNIPDVMNEKDFFLILNKATPNLKRVVIADDSEVCSDMTRSLARLLEWLWLRTTPTMMLSTQL